MTTTWSKTTDPNGTEVYTSKLYIAEIWKGPQDPGYAVMVPGRTYNAGVFGSLKEAAGVAKYF
jgi:hypothetical protein